MVKYCIGLYVYKVMVVMCNVKNLVLYVNLM